jgi:hypothetical protein
MGAEEGGADGHGRLLGHAADDAQHLQFVFRGEAVTAFDFGGTRSRFHHLPQARHGFFVEFLFAGRVQAVCRVEDATAAAGDLLVGETVDLVHELAFAASGVDDVRVRVAEGGQYDASAGVDLFVRPPFGQLFHRSVGGDEAVLGGQVGVPDGLQAFHVGARDTCASAFVDTGERAYVLDR